MRRSNTASITALTVLAEVVDDRVETFDYDAAGRLKHSVDAMGFEESFVYDGVGNKVQFTNKRGATWDYVYDAAGRLTQEITPLVDVTTLAGNLAPNVTPQRLTTDPQVRRAREPHGAPGAGDAGAYDEVRIRRRRTADEDHLSRCRHL
jgi:YD repeat-containing protein